jgi:hypothetical protein
MVKIYDNNNFQSIYKCTYFLYFVRGLIILFIYINYDEYIFQGLNLFENRSSSNYKQARSV